MYARPEMAAILLDLKEGDEVIVPSYAFVTSALAFAMHGAKLIFIDIQQTPSILMKLN